MLLRDSLPVIYQGLLSDEFLNLFPQETRATCGSCYKTKPGAEGGRFNDQIKCCTFYPHIPNYLLGLGLQQAGRSDKAQAANVAANPATTILRTMISQRQYALPIGLCAPPAYQKKFNNKAPEDFGNAIDLACPFYQFASGNCGIWSFRGHECSTYFCVSSYAKGEEFWREVREILHETEMFISQMAMIEKGYSHLEITKNLEFVKLLHEDLNTAGVEPWQMSALEWSKIWAHHFEDIAGYYVATFEFVQNHKDRLQKELYEARPRTKPTYTRVLKDLLVGRALPAHH